MKRLVLSLLVIITLSLSSCMGNDERVVHITVDDLKLILKEDKNIQLLDVRTSREAKEGIIFNAMQVNLISNDFETRAVDVLDKTKPVYVYCRSGSRSKIASSVLADNGFEVFNVKGGYREWLRKTKIEK